MPPPSRFNYPHSSPLETGLNTILLFVIILSYVPQIYRIVSNGSTAGIAPGYVLFNYLFAATQWTTINVVFLPITPYLEKCKEDGKDIYGAFLGHLQIGAQCFGAALMVVLCLRYPDEIAKEPAPNLDGSRRLVASVCIIHTLIWTLPVTYMVLWPPREGFNWKETQLYSAMPFLANGICYYFFIPLSPFLAVAPLATQIKRISDGAEPLDLSSMSVWTLAIQTSTFYLVGISWMYRLGSGPLLGWLAYITRIDLFHWYAFGPWPVVNYIIFGIAQGILYVLYCCQKLQSTLGDSHNIAGTGTDERIPLLA